MQTGQRNNIFTASYTYSELEFQLLENKNYPTMGTRTKIEGGLGFQVPH